MQARLLRTAITVVALAVAFATFLVATAGATHVRPKGATPKYDQLAIDYKRCVDQNAVHGGPGPSSPLTGQPSCPRSRSRRT